MDFSIGFLKTIWMSCSRRGTGDGLPQGESFGRWVGARGLIAIALLAAFILSSVAPSPVLAQNAQKQYPLRSPEYEALRTLYIAQGIALPFSSGPFSEAEIRLALDRLDTSDMTTVERDTFDWISQQLADQSGAGSPAYTEEEGRFAFDIGAEFSLETYLHTDPENRYWQYRWEDREPFARFPMEGWVGQHAYGIFDLGLLKGIPDFSVYPTYNDKTQYGFDSDGEFALGTSEEDPWTNWPVVTSPIDIQFPHRAFIAVGGDRWSASLGRDQIDWGNGRTGNLYISDYVEWYDSLQFSSFWNRFKFSWMWTSLDGTIIPEEMEYEERVVGWDTDSDGSVDTYTEPTDGSGEAIYSYDADEEHKNLVAQRFEVRLWDRLGLAYTMGIIFGREYIELRHLNPIYDYHNLYTNTQWVGNAHRSYEFDFAAAPGVSIYGVISPDQWTSPLEPETNLEKEPNAYVALLGVDLRRPAASGFLAATIEGVYATPWMHIHNSPLTSITSRRFVMAHHSDGPTQLWYDKPIGHYGGNDFALLWLDLAHEVPGRYRYGVNVSGEGDGSVPINALLESKVSNGLREQLDNDDATAAAPSSGFEGRRAMWTNQATIYGEVLPQWGNFNGNGRSGGRIGGAGDRASAGHTNGGRSPSLRLATELTGQWMKNRFHMRDPWRFDLQWVISTTIGW